ncbi:MAG: energy-coupling factor ABC transporter ATP-binding protein [Planctomycetota bacterium]|jgi:cobalt/nickel transport system ATP-binding protein|nr:energy-coupling factor ABC transporter ATP-binding protein [Planctomycetota bacterium]
MNPPRLELDEVAFAYPGGEAVISGLSLVFSAAATAIIGANGAGKSTLLQLLVGALFPSSGEIRLDGEILSRNTAKLFRRRLGLTFQDPDDQLFLSSIGEDAAFGPRHQGLSPAEAAARAREALGLVGLAELAGRPPFRLSGGERRLAALASVLSMRPDLLLLDEPTAALDPRAKRRVREVLAGLEQPKIITTHDLDLVWDLCEQTIILKNGGVAASGGSREILADAGLLESCGLELPPSLRGCPRCGGGKTR